MFGLSNNDIRIRGLFFILAICLLSGCGDDQPIAEEEPTGSAEAMRNGLFWTAEAEIHELVTIEPRYSLGLAVPPKGDAFREALNIRGFLPILGTQRVLSDDLNNVEDIYSDLFILTDDGDGFIAVYVLDTSYSDNFIDIQNYDPASLEIEGAFNIRLKLSQESQFEFDLPDSVIYTNGTFLAKVEPGWFD